MRYSKQMRKNSKTTEFFITQSGDNSDSDWLWVTDFTEESALNFHEKAWQLFSKNPSEPILVNISSYGGEVFALLNMMSTMDNIRAVAGNDFMFITYVHGYALSCAIHLAAHGDLRIATPQSEFMFHETSRHIGEQRAHQELLDAEYTKKLNEKLNLIFVKNTDFKGGVNKLMVWGEKDRWLSPQEAKDLNIIDVIGYVKPKTMRIEPVSVGEASPKQLTTRKKAKKEKR